MTKIHHQPKDTLFGEYGTSPLYILITELHKAVKDEDSNSVCGYNTPFHCPF